MTARITPLICLLFVSLSVSGQSSDSTLRGLFGVGLSYHKGFVFAHSEDVANTAGSYPWGIQLDFNWQLRSQNTWDNCYCYPRTGFVVQYFNYDNDVLGHGLHAAAYIEPYLNATGKVSFSLKGMAGLSYSTNPFDANDNPNNNSYSLPVNGYLAFGLGVHFRAGKHINVHLYANYNHISNGGIKLPNKGINWPTAVVGIDYTFEPYYLPVREKSRNKNYPTKPVRIESGVYFSSISVETYESDRWPVGGVYLHFSKPVSMVNALNAGAEIWYDAALAEQLRRKNNTDATAWRAGIPFGNEFLMGRFVFSQQLGVYLLNSSGYYPQIYQRYGLMFIYGRGLCFGINLLAHANVANFLDFRIAYSSR